MKKKVLFLTGTRADYGKIKPLMRQVDQHSDFELYIFVTGMHTLSKYGSTWNEIKKDGFINTYVYVNQNNSTSMDLILSNTIMGLSNYVNELKPDLIVVHGDRLEPLAGAIVGSFSNIRVAHIEGGEISGTIDESIRHAITKMSHIHFVCNRSAKDRLIQMGEKESSIFIIGSADIDVMLSDDLPPLSAAKERYMVDYANYGVLIYHPVTTELHLLEKNVEQVISGVTRSGENFIVVYPNNDHGNEIILNSFQLLQGRKEFRIFPSIKFEYFLTFLKHASFIIGNSSAGIREAMVYGLPAINLGNRQNGRYTQETHSNVIAIDEDEQSIVRTIKEVKGKKYTSKSIYGTGNTAKLFIEVLEASQIWNIDIQKQFIDFNQQRKSEEIKTLRCNV